jgi:4'-phosphopantetheinyl transferase
MHRIDVWTACTEVGHATAQPIYDRWLNVDERRRAARLVALPDRLSFSAAHALLHWAIWHSAGIVPAAQLFAKTVFDRPHLVPPPGCADPMPTFSISHSRGLVAVAVGLCSSIGIDVETPDRRFVEPVALAEGVLAAPEADWVAQPSEPEQQLQRLLQIWTLKEALVKAVGVGLTVAVDSFTVQTDPPQMVSNADDLRAQGRWHLEQWQPDSQGWAALAVDEDPARPVEISKRHLNRDELVELLANM